MAKIKFFSAFNSTNFNAISMWQDLWLTCLENMILFGTGYVVRTMILDREFYQQCCGEWQLKLNSFSGHSRSWDTETCQQHLSLIRGTCMNASAEFYLVLSQRLLISMKTVKSFRDDSSKKQAQNCFQFVGHFLSSQFLAQAF